MAESEPVVDATLFFERRTAHFLSGKVILSSAALTDPLIHLHLGSENDVLLKRLADDIHRWRITLTPITEANGDG